MEVAARTIGQTETQQKKPTKSFINSKLITVSHRFTAATPLSQAEVDAITRRVVAVRGVVSVQTANVDRTIVVRSLDGRVSREQLAMAVVGASVDMDWTYDSVKSATQLIVTDDDGKSVAFVTVGKPPTENEEDGGGPDYLPESYGESPKIDEKLAVTKSKRPANRDGGGILGAITNVLQKSFFW